MLYFIIRYIGYLLLIINCILYLKSFSKFVKAFKVYTCYLVLLMTVQMTMEILTKFVINNLFFVHVYFVGQFLLMGYFYKILLKSLFYKKLINFIFIFILLALGIQYFIEPSLFFKFNLFEIILTSLAVMFMALIYLYNMLTGKKEYYYITVGIIIYLFTSTILFLVGNLTIGLSKNLKLISWTLNAFLVLLNQLFILYEWKVSFSKKTISQS